MRRAQRRWMWLAVCVAVLVVLAAWQWRHDRAAAPGVLLTLDPAAITHVEVQVRGQSLRRFEKRAGHWWMLAPASQRADDDRLDAMTAIAAAPVVRWRAASDFNAATIGLDPPVLVLTLDGESIAYGTMAAFGPQRYVRVGHRVALIPAQYAPRSPAPLKIGNAAR